MVARRRPVRRTTKRRSTTTRTGRVSGMKRRAKPAKSYGLRSTVRGFKRS